MTVNLLEQLVASAADRFAQRYGRPPRWIVAAPGRVNVIGEHIDYNDGFVLPMAIDRYCVIAAGEANDADRMLMATMYSVAADEETRIPLSIPSPRITDSASELGATGSASVQLSGATGSASAQSSASPGHWSNYVAGVIAGCGARDMRPRGFHAVIESSVPYGGGLSSSASLEVATATLIESMTGHMLDPVDKALLCQQAEHEYAGVPCGIMDQFASVLGRADHLMLLDCRSREIEQIPFTDPRISVLIINTNVKHELSGGEYAERRGQCESAARKLGVASLRDATPLQLEAQRARLDEREFRRARHAISEIERTVAAASAVKAGDWPRVGQLMYASHDSLRDDYEVSCRELDLLVDWARELVPQGGVIGSRMTGGGFGGCTVSLVEASKVDAVAGQLAQSYRVATGIEPAIFVSRPARGAHIVQS